MHACVMYHRHTHAYASGFIFADAHSNPADLNHALELYLQAPAVGLRQDIATALLGEMIREPCFNQVRALDAPRVTKSD